MESHAIRLMKKAIHPCLEYALRIAKGAKNGDAEDIKSVKDEAHFDICSGCQSEWEMSYIINHNDFDRNDYRIWFRSKNGRIVEILCGGVVLVNEQELTQTPSLRGMAEEVLQISEEIWEKHGNSRVELAWKY